MSCGLESSTIHAGLKSLLHTYPVSGDGRGNVGGVILSVAGLAVVVQQMKPPLATPASLGEAPVRDPAASLFPDQLSANGPCNAAEDGPPKDLGPCHPLGRPRSSSWLMASA